jgi:archaeal type IV pilus assembly protein PilA
MENLTWRCKEKMKNFNRNLKAISPIFATLILIAIAVIAGVVVYMFTSGTLATMTGGGTAAQEKITVQAASVKSGILGTGQVTVYLQQTGGPAATINSIIIKSSTGSTLGVVPAASLTFNPAVTTTLTSGTLYTISSALTFTIPATVVAGSSYSLTVTTAAGGNFISIGVVAT